MYRDDDTAGAYTAERAAPLSGVPRSTVHYWARNEILVPSVSREKVKLWSFGDLLKLRTIYWLRQPKTAQDGRDIPASTMPKVRRALGELDDLKLTSWDEHVFVDRSGHVFIKHVDGVLVDTASPEQSLLPFVDVVAPFSMIAFVQGPDLLVPRPHLRIVPSKLAGSPHVTNTRVETQAIAALHKRGFDMEAIARLYPMIDTSAIEEAIDLEKQLDGNLSVAA